MSHLKRDLTLKEREGLTDLIEVVEEAFDEKVYCVHVNTDRSDEDRLFGLSLSFKKWR